MDGGQIEGLKNEFDELNNAGCPLGNDGGGRERRGRGGALDYPGTFIRGDVNQDREVTLPDAISIFGFLFLGDQTPTCMDSADVNDDGAVELSNGAKLLNILFLGDSMPWGTVFPLGAARLDGRHDRM